MGKVPKIGSHDQEKNDCNRQEHPEEGPIFFVCLVWISRVEIDHGFPLVPVGHSGSAGLPKGILPTAVEIGMGAFLEGCSQKLQW